MAKETRKEDEEELTGRESFKLDLFFWLQAFVAVLCALVLVFSFLGRVIVVDGSSMVPTLHHGDLLLLQGIGYTPEQGDIVVLTKEFQNVDTPIVKRIIATGGQTVHIDYSTSTVYVDGVALDEPYINELMRMPMGETITDVTVPEGSVFVMGDNRNNSSDSRVPELGTVDERYILGEVLLVLFPFQNFGIVH
ncbi:MAG TPA: signal peptidase I [Candidatus Galloscillospira stercoripullorum]|nr:signal peptidase I [Candidatus Galloscillospira stercoripullorum]